MGVPLIGCGCPTCTSTNPKNQRTRCSLALGLPGGNLLIDTTPELRLQLIRERIGRIHAVLYTHDHADHLFGFDDVRIFPVDNGFPLPIYGEQQVHDRIHKAFDYCFSASAKALAAGYVPQVELRPVTLSPLEILGQQFIPLRLLHGRFQVLGFRFGNIAYCTDTHEIPPASLAQLEGLDVLILDCLRHEPHVSHLHLEAAVDIARRLRPKRTLFTHISCRLEHEATQAQLPPGIEMAYDGLRVPLS